MLHLQLHGLPTIKSSNEPREGQQKELASPSSGEGAAHQLRRTSPRPLPPPQQCRCECGEEYRTKFERGSASPPPHLLTLDKPRAIVILSLMFRAHGVAAAVLPFSVPSGSTFGVDEGMPVALHRATRKRVHAFWVSAHPAVLLLFTYSGQIVTGHR